MDGLTADPTNSPTPAWTRLVVTCAGGLGIVLMLQAAAASSATYDEVAYLRIAADWWRRDETSEITRMGSPLTFFKLQAAPAFFVLDHVGLGGLIDRPVVDQASLLPIVRIASLWIWLVAFGLTVFWSRRVYGPRAMAFAACLFALSPNLLAHGSIATMEMPLIAATATVFFFFLRFLETGRARDFAASAIVAGLAFSCKFTAVVYPPILGLLWAVDLWRRGERRVWSVVLIVIPAMAAFVAGMLAADWVVTGFALIRPSPRTGSHPSAPGLGSLLEIPMPQDWVGFATQLRHQRNGGPSYLLGERRMTGWWYYYPVALAVKVPLGCWLLLVGRAALGLRKVREGGRTRDWFFPLAIAAFLAVAMFGSKRNYGVRYLLPMAPLAIVWMSALAERRGGWRWVVGAGLIGQAVALATIHPYELSYFNVLAGGKIGGRQVLADSNLDWGQGLRSLVRLEAAYQPMTLFYFGDVEPYHYGYRGQWSLFTAEDRESPAHPIKRLLTQFGRPYFVSLPKTICRVNEGVFRGYAGLPQPFRMRTRYVAVSASLQYGPWGPADYFRPLQGLKPAAFTDDGTIAIYDLLGTQLLEDRLSYFNFSIAGDPTP